jgi:hypothetical protein
MGNINGNSTLNYGIISSINADGMSGQVQQDETGETFPFSGQDLTGLSVNSIVSFTLNTDRDDNTTASMLTLLTMNPPQTIKDSVSENITAVLGDVITITKGATLSGSVTINGGKVIVDPNSSISGGVTVNGGIIVARGGQVGGGMININNGGSIKAVGGGSISGNGIVINQGGRMIAGNSNGTGIIATATGTTISIQGIRRITVADDGTSAING